MTRNDASIRLRAVVSVCETLRRDGFGLRTAARQVSMAPSVLRRYLVRHEYRNLSAGLVHNDKYPLE